jgi:ribonuclease III family protein
MLFGRTFHPELSAQEACKLARNLDLRTLAHLGDSVFELFERERVLTLATVDKVHKKVVGRVNSKEQARLLLRLRPLLLDPEQDIVRRARNLKPSGFRRNVEQSILRQATAFEALVGFLYLTDETRLKELLLATTSENEPDSALAADEREDGEI